MLETLRATAPPWVSPPRSPACFLCAHCCRAVASATKGVQKKCAGVCLHVMHVQSCVRGMSLLFCLDSAQVNQPHVACVVSACRQASPFLVTAHAYSECGISGTFCVCNLCEHAGLLLPNKKRRFLVSGHQLQVPCGVRHAGMMLLDRTRMLLVGGMCDLNGAGPADMVFLNDAFEYDFELRWWRQARARTSLHSHSRTSQVFGSMEPKRSFLDDA